MGKILLHGNWKKQKALTLVETVVSLSIIVLVSAAVTSIAVYSSNIFHQLDVKNVLKMEIDNIATIYLSYDESDFYPALNTYTGLSDEHTTYYNSNLYINSELAYVEEANKVYTVSLNFSNKTLTLDAYDTANELITSRSVTR